MGSIADDCLAAAKNNMSQPDPSPAQHLEREALLQTALDCYLGTIQHISDFLGTMAPELASPHQEQLLKLRHRVAYEPTTEALLESRQILDRELQAVAAKADDSRAGKVEDLQRISLFLAQVDDVFLLRKHGCADQLRHLSRQIQEVENLSDPAQARNQLNAHLNHLRTFVETVQQDGSQVFSRLQEQIDEYRTNLSIPEMPASSDPETGLPNLREFARQIDSRLQSTVAFCLLIFHLEWLHDAQFEVEILKQVGARLTSMVRARDLVCHWESGKFLVILECGLAEATARAREIALSLSGHYRAEIDGRETIAELKVSVGVTERHAGDSLHELVVRAESSHPA